MEITVKKGKRRIKMRRPKNPHVHLRRGNVLETVLPFTADVFEWAIAKGNFPGKPIETADDVIDYRNEIRVLRPDFQVKIPIMLTKNTTSQVIIDARGVGAIAVAFMPDLISTNAKYGVGWYNVNTKRDCFATMQDLRMPLMIHAEESRRSGEKLITPFRDRENLALSLVHEIAIAFPDLPISIEHISDGRTVDYLEYYAPPNVAGGICPKYFFCTEKDVYDENGWPRPDFWCMPVFKTEADRDRLILAATSGSRCFFGETDSAPHQNKDPHDPSPGIFCEPVAFLSSVEIFDEAGALTQLEPFWSENGAKHYGLPLNEDFIILVEDPWLVPEEINGIKIFMGGRTMKWRIVNE